MRPEAATSLRQGLLALFRDVRAETERRAAPLSPEDQGLQSMPDASPAKWHRAHVTWFFETLVLAPFARDYRPYDPAYGRLFNSYYEALGPRHPRPERGLLSRPTAAEITRYRAHVDAAMTAFLEGADADTLAKAAPLVTLGCHHEQQHQELLLMDIKHAFFRNPTFPAYAAPQPRNRAAPAPLHWIAFRGGDVAVGHDGKGFAFDNEGPRHEVKLRPYALAARLVTNGEWRDFMADGGYRRPELWLSDGWAAVQREGWDAPLHWLDGDIIFTLRGAVERDDAAPVCHVSYYEADAYARWVGKRLPTEFEWEAAAPQGLAGVSGARDPYPASAGESLAQMAGEVWQWTASPYTPYPGFRPFAGAAGEYNGKFMVNQLVLRGGACITPPGHIRATYRNFYYPHTRWHFSGLRLAEDR